MSDQKQTFNEQIKDPGFLVVKGNFSGDAEVRLAEEKKHISKLSSAIIRSIANNGYANLRAIGKNATSNAVKAIAIASSKCHENNIRLYWGCSFDTGNIGPLQNQGHVANVSAIVFKIEKWEDLQNETGDLNNV